MSPRRMATLLTVAALSLAACASPGPTDPTDSGTTATEEGSTAAPLTVGLTYIPDIQFAPFYVAAASGYFEDEGLDVTLRHHGASESLFGALAAGEEDVVNAGADEMLQAFAGTVPVVTFGVIYHEYPVVVIVPEASEMTSVADLAGHRVGLPGPYGENWFALLAIMKDAGLTEADLTIEHIGFTQQAALVSNQVDAVVGFSNNDFVTFQGAGIPVRILDAPELPLVGISVGALSATVETRGDDLAALNRALGRAMEDILADPSAAVDLVFETVDELAVAGDKEAALRTLTATMELYDGGSLAPDVDAWPVMYEFMVSAGLAEPDADPLAAVDGTLAP